MWLNIFKIKMVINVKKLLSILAIFFIFQTNSFADGINMHTLNNGLRVILKSDTSNQIVAANLFIDVGSIRENPEDSGITNLTQTLLLKGSKNRTALQIAEEIESMGGEINSSASEDYSTVEVMTATPDIYKALDILYECVFFPTFPQDEIDKEIDNTLSYMKLKEDDKFYLCFKELKKLLFQGHPYSMPVEGTEETVPTFDKKEITEFYKSFYCPDNMILCVVGNFNEQKMLAEIKKNFGKIKRQSKPTFTVSKDFREKTKETIKTKEIEQSFVIIGYIGPKIQEDDYPALKVAASILGGGMSSRLFVELRDKQGLAYAVGAAVPSRKIASPFITYIGTKPESTEIARQGLLDEVEKLKKGTISQEELDRTKNYIIGNFLIDHQTNSKQAWYLGFYEMMAMGFEFDNEYPKKIQEVTIKDVQKAARKYLNHPTTSILKPPAEINSGSM